MTDCILVLVTTGSEAEAELIAKALLEERLAACVNVLNPIRSMYRWEGKIADDQEWLLVIKTQSERFADLEAKVKTLHSYQVPEVIALPIVQGAAGYLQWLRQETDPA